MKWQAESPARFMAQQPLHVRGYAYALQVIAYADYQAQLKQYQAENYAYARAGTTREAEALRIYNEKLAIHHRWQAEQAAIEHERAQLLFYDTVTATAQTLSDPSTAIHLTLDVLGMIPVIGEPADGLNALIYLAEGDEVNAAISAAGMLPIGGMAVTGARAVKTAVKTGLRAAEQIAATSLSMLKVAPPAPTAVLKIDTSAATPPTAPVGAATPPAPKPADAVPASQASPSAANKVDGQADCGAGAACSLDEYNEFRQTQAYLETIDDGVSYPPQAEMLRRIESSVTEGAPLSPGQRTFLDHELVEQGLVNGGTPLGEAHDLVQRIYPPGSNFDPDVLMEFSEYFGPANFDYWGLVKP